MYSVTSLMYQVTVAFTLHSSREFCVKIIPLLSWVTLPTGCLSQSGMVDSSLNVAVISFQLSLGKLEQ